MWIKICGMNHPEAVAAALEAGADALGAVLAPSVRRVSAEYAADLLAPAVGVALRVMVTRHPDKVQLQHDLDVLRPDYWQSDLSDMESLQTPPDFRRLPVLRSGHDMPAMLPELLLFESPNSGSGETADWTEAATLTKSRRLVLAGGLRPDNVAAAVNLVRPWGVDVSSGVESAAGVKSPEKILQFVRAARAAAGELGL
jgi:phosphoribosylanthranilate isomerase